METLNKIYEHGVEVIDPDLKTTQTVRGLLLLCTVDLQAKAILANHKQYNGGFGCNSCEDEGKIIKGAHRVWPYDGPTVLRTHDKYEDYLDEVVRTGEPHKGVKGASILYLHQPFDMGQSLPSDWMHGCLLGVEPTMLELWVGPKHSKKDFYIGDKIVWMSKQLLNIKVPDTISRAPRSLMDRHHMKASERRAMLLHFEPAILREVLPAKYYAHYLLLHSAIATLVSDNISTDQMDKAEQKLDVFCKTFEGLYGESPQTMNIHLLRHLVLHVRLFGPLWAFSCFGFESVNGEIKRLVHGTKFVVEQITCTLAMESNLQRVVRTMTPERESPRVVRLARRLCVLEKRRNMTELGPGIHRLGILNSFPRVLDLGEDIKKAIQERTGEEDAGNYGVFYRVSLRGQRIHSRGYSRERARNNRTIEYKARNGSVRYGEVLLFCAVNGEDLAVLAVLEPVDSPLISVDKVSNPDVKRALTLEMESFVVEVAETDICTAIPINDIHRKCVLMEISTKKHQRTYIGRFPNISEHN
ncbi:Hypp7304 [Branchiostoma lanceolatum]|uniref:Hypp7304 protein n=1 Tax=Branchiostoma lanceolatum TaxID=7740 RepID=A0A8J9YZG4_BRALA|nr:Hypp7304 [Branchiostoma lanceolatum]